MCDFFSLKNVKSLETKLKKKNLFDFEIKTNVCFNKRPNTLTFRDYILKEKGCLLFKLKIDSKIGSISDPLPH